MKRRTVASVVILIAVSLVLSSCSALDIFSTESLLRAPKLTGEYALLQEAFEKSAGDGTVAVIPIAGDYRSAYATNDFDNDGIDEAVVLYSRQDEDSVVRIHMLSYSGGEWASVSDVAGAGSGVYEICFSDFDGDGFDELVIVWSSSVSERSKTMVIYRVCDGQNGISEISSLASIQAENYFFDDFSGGPGNEIFYAYRSSTEGESPLHCQLLDFSDGIPAPVTQVDLPSDVTEIAQLLCCDLSAGKRVYVDCTVNNGSFTTTLIDYSREDRVFTLPLNAMQDSAEDTSRKGPVFCRDIDGDGVPEIPVETSFANGEMPVFPSSKVSFSVIKWVSPSPDGMKTVSVHYVNYNDNYSVCVDKFYDYSYITYDAKSRTARWFLNESSYVNPDASPTQIIPEESGGELIFSLIFSPGVNETVTRDSFLVVVTETGEEMNIRSSYVTSLIEINAGATAREGK